jgi:hypothetical protein
MKLKLPWTRPLLTVTQMIALAAAILALFIVLDLNRRAQAGKQVGVGQEALDNQVQVEQTRQVELQATYEYVQSDAYVAAYAREEGGLLLPGEKRIVPLIAASTPQPAAPSGPPTPDPAADARPWHAWWQLLTDRPLPVAPAGPAP